MDTPIKHWGTTWDKLSIRQLGAGKSLGYRQIDFESGSLSWSALYFDSAAVILNDPVTNRQAQSQAGFFPGSEKWLENLRQIFRRNPEAGVGYSNSNFLGTSGGTQAELGAHGQHAPFRHRVNGVEIQIDQDLFQFLGIGVNL